MSKPDAKRRYRRRRAARAQPPAGPIGMTVRFAPIVNGKLGAPLYPCNWCGKLVVLVRGALCDDCIPF